MKGSTSSAPGYECGSGLAVEGSGGPPRSSWQWAALRYAAAQRAVAPTTDGDCRWLCMLLLSGVGVWVWVMLAV